MKQLLVILMAALMITACKKSETTQTTIMNSKGSETANGQEMPISTEPLKPIDLSEPSVEEFAIKYDNLFNDLVEAGMKKDKDAVLAIKPKIAELDKAIKDNASKLSGQELDVFNGFIEKRKSTAQEIISKY